MLLAGIDANLRADELSQHALLRLANGGQPYGSYSRQPAKLIGIPGIVLETCRGDIPAATVCTGQIRDVVNESLR